MSNILVLCGSSRINGNSDLLANNYIKGAQDANHQVERLDANLLDFKPCTGCDMCWTDDQPCVYDDDTSMLEEKLKEADVITIITPMYWYSYPAGLKLIIDKFYPYIPDKYPQGFKNKSLNLIVCSAEDRTDIFKAMELSFIETTKYMNWDVNETLYVPNVVNREDVLTKTEYNQAYQMGNK